MKLNYFILEFNKVSMKSFSIDFFNQRKPEKIYPVN